MSLHVEVKKMSQDISFEDGRPITQNYVLFQLPNGGIVKASIDDVAAEALLDSLMKGSESTKVIQQDTGYNPPAGFQQTTLPSGEEALEFGGETAEPPPPVMPPAPSNMHAKMKLVGKDEYGYPIMRPVGGGTSDPGELSTVGTADEDGVGQV